tara:strand:- start:403 stop:966 length:564 start_codon:yes stop_codon:yes gene_type:complete
MSIAYKKKELKCATWVGNQCIVSFDNTKLLKELGFAVGNRKSFCQYNKSYTYDGDKSHPESHRKGEIRLDGDFYTVNNKDDYDLSNKHYTIYEAPSQELVKKWLRDKFNIEIVVSRYKCWENINEDTDKKKEVDYYVVRVDDYRNGETHEATGYFTPVHYHLDEYDTYEKAFEEGITRGLKILKDEK